MIAPGGSIKIRRGELRKSQTRVRGRPERHQSFFTSAARAQKRVRRANAACTLPASAVISTRVCRRCCLWISWRPNRSEFIPTGTSAIRARRKGCGFFLELLFRWFFMSPEQTRTLFSFWQPAERVFAPHALFLQRSFNAIETRSRALIATKQKELT